MPELAFTEAMVKLPSNHCCQLLKKYKLVSAIFHVLLLHNGPTTVKLFCSVGELQMESEFDQIFSYLARVNHFKELVLINYGSYYKLPVSFFSLQGLERLELEHCVFELPSTFKGFSHLKSMTFYDVKLSAQMRFLFKCPLLEYISWVSGYEGVDYAAGGNNFTYVDLLRCLPLIQTLDIAMHYMKYLSAEGMPHKLSTSLFNLKKLFLEVCLMEHNEISSALCLIRSSPVLDQIIIQMCDNEKLPVRQTPANFLDLEFHSDLKLDHLEMLVIEWFGNLPLELEFVKLIMAKSPVLKKVQIEVKDDASADEEVKMFRDLVLTPFPRASPSAEIIIKRS